MNYLFLSYILFYPSTNKGYLFLNIFLTLDSGNAYNILLFIVLYSIYFLFEFYDLKTSYYKFGWFISFLYNILTSDDKLSESNRAILPLVILLLIDVGFIDVWLLKLLLNNVGWFPWLYVLWLLPISPLFAFKNVDLRLVSLLYYWTLYTYLLSSSSFSLSISIQQPYFLWFKYALWKN